LNPTSQVTWVRAPRPVLDLVGLIVGSLELTGVFALVAFVLGSLLGIAFILRRRLVAHRLPGDDFSLSSDASHFLES
jgi:hypothetical protein